MKAVMTVLASILLVAAAPARAINEGSETGDTFGLSRALPGGGDIRVVRSLAGNSSAYAPAAGRYFLALRPGPADRYVSAFHSYRLQAGDTLTGYAAFVARDTLPNNDSADVVVRLGAYSLNGPVVATPFSASVASVGAHRDGPWTPWSFTAPADGDYTVQWRVANAGDGEDDSYALFDADELRIDIKPGSSTNVIDVSGPGIFPVAILSTPGFAATRIERASIRFGESGGNTSGPSLYYDINHDGATDVVAAFKTSRTQLLCWSRHGFLTARLDNGLILSGSDSVVPVGSDCP